VTETLKHPAGSCTAGPWCCKQAGSNLPVDCEIACRWEVMAPLPRLYESRTLRCRKNVSHGMSVF
jgi:hypothetical protein